MAPNRESFPVSQGILKSSHHPELSLRYLKQTDELYPKKQQKAVTAYGVHRLAPRLSTSAIEANLGEQSLLFIRTIGVVDLNISYYQAHKPVLGLYWSPPARRVAIFVVMEE